MKWCIILMILCLTGCTYTVKDSFPSNFDQTMCYYSVENGLARRSVIYEKCGKYEVGDYVRISNSQK